MYLDINEFEIILQLIKIYIKLKIVDEISIDPPLKRGISDLQPGSEQQDIVIFYFYSTCRILPIFFIVSVALSATYLYSAPTIANDKCFREREVIRHPTLCNNVSTTPLD